MPAPKITHQIWLQGWDNLPEKYKGNVEGMVEMNPEYQHMKWDEKSLRKECLKISDECLAKFESFELIISKVDFGRYVVLYNYGGISVDTDMVSLQPIRNTPYIGTSDFLISYQAYPFNLLNIKNNAVIICTPKNSILKDIIIAIIQNKKVVSDFMSKELYVHFTTSNYVVGEILNAHPNEFKVLDYKYFEPCNSNDPYCTIPSDSIMDHQHEMSWMNPIMRYFFAFMFFVLNYFVYILFIIGAAVAYSIYRKNARFFKGRRRIF